MSYKDNQNEKRLIAVSENKEKKVNTRNSYNESAILKGAVIKNQTIDQIKPGMGNYFERVVSLKKNLMNTIVEKHPWIFSRIDLKYAPIQPSRLTIVIEHNIGGHTYKSKVFGDSALLGNIIFTRSQK